MDMIPCPKCKGAGQVEDKMVPHRKTGAELKAMRRSSNKQLKEVANYLGISTSMLSHLEHGNRVWTEQRIAAYQDCCRDVIK